MKENKQIFPITPEAFWNRFAENLKSAWQKQAVRKLYTDSASWTAFMTQLMKNMAYDFSCVETTEYWPKIDVGYFDNGGEDWGEWAFEVAIELENSSKTWHQELSKLASINAGLKVLVTYDDNEDHIKETLEKFIAIKKSRKYEAPNTAWLVIIGPNHPPDKQDFVAYAIRKNKIRKITGRKSILVNSI